ncbi:hypothetical protein NDU88_000667 [Pleurodeles waltl]|uniref:Uncharacterized protein n=1 Tax=Pleurodeles waltl TaxID=8319 RepID=A0AAV7USI5_PLEWA|nr:hypothetical protein NDU88_000667 [Pleurodeles waltl]
MNPDAEKENRDSTERAASQETKVEESDEEKESQCGTTGDRTEGVASRMIQSELSAQRDWTDTRARHILGGMWLTQLPDVITSNVNPDVEKENRDSTERAASQETKVE